MSILLSHLLNGFADIDAAQDTTVRDMTLDSREIKSGSVFVALQGTKAHGLQFVTQAIAADAVAVLFEQENDSHGDTLRDQYVPPIAINNHIPCIGINQLRDVLGTFAKRFFLAAGAGYPQHIIGITGTDGKTSVSHFIASVLDNAAVIGTLGIGQPSNLEKATHTTPDVINVHRYLSELASQSVNVVAMEVSSHALDQGRVNDVDFEVAVLTNLSRDHLDYHKTLAAYAEAKARLFRWNSLKTVVLNLDDKFGQQLANTDVAVIGYSLNTENTNVRNTVVALKPEFSEQGIHALIHYNGEQIDLKAAVLGRFNLSNLLATIATLIALGFSLSKAVRQVEQVKTVAGRMERIETSMLEKVLIVVDYAHTPEALKSVLAALKEHAHNRLLCVFGCGGDRDKGKRPLMAEAAERYADVVIVTDDNPRTESPGAIVNDIKQGFVEPDNVVVLHDRKQAIRFAMQQLSEGDALLIAGKGHETEQVLATGAIPFDDRVIARAVLQEMAA